MMKIRWLSVFTVIFAAVSVFAQQDPESDRHRKVIALADAIVADAKGMRLPENRAIAFANLGNRLWEVDKKRAEELFNDSVAELIAAQNEAETDRRQGRQTELVTGQSTRPTVLRAIANRNADLALKSFYQTRPIAIERALANVSVRDSKIRSMTGGEAHLISNELSLEQSLLRTAADQSPDKAVVLLKTALKKGISAEALGLLQKLHAKDPAAAAEMAAEVNAQLLKKGLMVNGQPDYNVIQTAFTFLTDHIRDGRPNTDKAFRFAAPDMRALADKLISFFLEKGSQHGYPYAFQMIQVAEKLRPDALEKLKEIERFTPRRGLTPFSDPEISRLMNPETPLEQILAEAPKIPVESRRQVYQQAANRLVAAGDSARARQIISDNFSGEALTSAQEALNWQQVHRYISEGKFAEAESLIHEIPDPNSRFSSLISLADAAYSRNMAENKHLAMGFLAKVGASLSPKPENAREMQQTIQLAAAYTRIEPPEAFRIIEGLIPQINELTEASVMINGFNNSHAIRKGEMIFSAGGAGNGYVDGSVIRGLGQKDLERTVGLIGMLTRREMRVNFMQVLLESL